MIIKLVRHGLSMQNTNEVDSRNIGDHLIPLDETGHAPARKAGRIVGADFIEDALLYCSPYLRTRQTFANVLIGAGIARRAQFAEIDDLCALARLANEEGRKARTKGSRKKVDAKAGKGIDQPNLTMLAAQSGWLSEILSEVCVASGMRYLEDPRLREVEHGLGDVAEQEVLRKIHSYFYYRLADGGESPADGYNRTCTFLDSMARQAERKKKKKAMIVMHGLKIREFVMRYLHLKVEDFDRMQNPKNCDIVTIGPADEIENPAFTNGKYAVTGIRLIERNPYSVRPSKRQG
jgi:Phosphohistidine phosphatase SixA